MYEVPNLSQSHISFLRRNPFYYFIIKKKKKKKEWAYEDGFVWHNMRGEESFNQEMEAGSDQKKRRMRERERVCERMYCIPLPLLVWRKSRVRVRARANISNFFTYSSQISCGVSKRLLSVGFI